MAAFFTHCINTLSKRFAYVKYIYACRIRNTDDSSLFRYETFINFLTFSFLTRGERDTIFTMLTVLSDPANALRIP